VSVLAGTHTPFAVRFPNKDTSVSPLAYGPRNGQRDFLFRFREKGLLFLSCLFIKIGTHSL
jgi:hypothetical protein